MDAIFLDIQVRNYYISKMKKQCLIKNEFETDFICPEKYNRIYQNRQASKIIYDKLYRMAM
jgi:hypothetical protein